MRKSLHETATIDRYLFGILRPEEAEAFRVRLLLEPELSAAVYWQQRAHRAIRLEALHRHLMEDPCFRNQVDLLFQS
jgi:hypothetical protein